MGRTPLLILTAAYLLLCLAAMVHMGQPDAWEWYLLAIPFLLWAIAPVASFLLMSRYRVADFIGAALCAAFGGWGYIDTAFLPPSDAQDGLVFLVVPVVQFIFALFWRALVAVVAHCRTRSLNDH